MDKEKIVELARTIGTYETSILPYDDCCTLFVPKHPETRPPAILRWKRRRRLWPSPSWSKKLLPRLK